MEGSVNLSDDRVTVRRNGRVSANIAAREIVVLGEVVGNCEASDHFDIRSEGSLCGDIVVSRISVEDGAFLTGSIEIRQESALEAVEQEEYSTMLPRIQNQVETGDPSEASWASVWVG